MFFCQSELLKDIKKNKDELFNKKDNKNSSKKIMVNIRRGFLSCIELNHFYFIKQVIIHAVT